MNKALKRTTYPLVFSESGENKCEKIILPVWNQYTIFSNITETNIPFVVEEYVVLPNAVVL